MQLDFIHQESNDYLAPKQPIELKNNQQKKIKSNNFSLSIFFSLTINGDQTCQTQTQLILSTR